MLMKKLFICLLFFSFTAFAQKSNTFYLDSLKWDKKVRTGCKWHSGDNPEWVKVSFDDSQWEDIDPNKLFTDIPQVQAAEIGWFRFHIDVDSTWLNRPISTYFHTYGASEFYFNEQILFKVGVVSKDPTIEKTYHLSNGTTLKMLFSKPKGNVIAVRYSFTHSNFYFPNFYFSKGAPIELAFEDGLSGKPTFYMRIVKNKLFFVAVLGLFFGFAFTHFSFYYFLRHQKANLLFGLAMFAQGISFLSNYLLIDTISISFFTVVKLIGHFGMPMNALLLILAIHSYLKQPLTKGFWFILSLLVVAFVFLFTDINLQFEISFFQYSLAIATLYYLIILRRSVKTGNKSGLIIYYASILCFIGLSIAPINDMPFFNSSLSLFIRNIALYLNWFSVTLAMSLTLARDFAQTDGSLQLKLKEVQQLSDEKQEILRGQNETLEKQVKERTAELEATQAQLIEKEQFASAAAIRLQELDAIKTRLYTNITHEFRTPLTVILGMTQQIKDKPTAHLQSEGMPLAEGLNMITRNGQNLLNLVNQMLDLSKLESGHLALHYQQGDVVNFVKYIVESLHSLAESKGLQIHFISDLEQLTMDYDETRLQQVVSNLLSNAVKFTPKGGNIYVSLSIQNETFSFKVKDTGRGIAEADLPYIFDRFYQVDDTTTRHGEGTGIGLSLTRELVKLMHGTIAVKSQVNKGTEFEVVLPILHIADLKVAREQLPILPPIIDSFTADNAPLSKNEEISKEKPLVLIADDNADVRAYIASCLSTDYNLLIAQDGQECEDLAFDKIPDLIITDVMMPFKDGFEVCQTLKTDERTSHIPIIMLTAKADMDSKLQGLEHGADVYLMKPFNKDELLVRIKKLLELRQQLQQFYRSTLGGNTEGGKTQAIEKPNPLTNNADNAFVIKVRTLIETNLNKVDFDVEKLCRDLLLSTSQVHRKLTALTGLSTNSFMRYVRLVKSKEQLVQNAHFSISAVAYDCGFNDPAYFSRAFKQEFGMTPQMWREQNVG